MCFAAFTRRTKMNNKKELNEPSALFITAHCDDAELWAGGTISKYIDEGWGVTVGITYYDEVRKQESIRSANSLGHKIFFYNSGHSINQWIKDLIEKSQPEVLFTHQENDLHFQHKLVFNETLIALTGTKTRKKFPKRWYTYDTYYLSRIPSDLPILIDITNYFGKKISSLKYHHSQDPDILIKMATNINSLHGQKIRTKYAEAFYPFPLLGKLPKLLEIP
jgi:LmbE family N-acetylglucosaminyl deacetylase